MNIGVFILSRLCTSVCTDKNFINLYFDQSVLSVNLCRLNGKNRLGSGNVYEAFRKLIET